MAITCRSNRDALRGVSTTVKYSIWGLVAALLGGAVLYHSKGARLLFGERGGGDAHLRWQEQWYVTHRQNPYDVTYAALRVGAVPWDRSRNIATDPVVGVPDSGGYPPWAFTFGYLMFWPGWPAAKVYFFGVSLVMTAVAAVWAYLEARPFGVMAGLLAASAYLAISAHSTALQVGQYGSVVVGLLATAAFALRLRRDILGGLLVGLALLKPTIGGPFVLVLLMAGRWRALAACVGYVVASSILVWWLTRTSPFEMFLQSLSCGSEYVKDSQGLVGMMIRTGLTTKQVTPVLAALVLLPGIVVLLWARRRPILDLFAIASVVARIWAYHKSYDNMMLVFLLIALLLVACEGRRAGLVAFLAVGASLWAPASLSRAEGFVFVQIGCWIVGLITLLAAPTNTDVAATALRRDADHSGGSPMPRAPRLEGT